MDDLTVDWKQLAPDCKCELRVMTPCEPKQYDHFAVEAKYLKFYFHWRWITIRIPERLANWLLARCDFVYVELAECHFIQYWRDNVPE
jgi:hypothetical protein